MTEQTKENLRESSEVGQYARCHSDTDGTIAGAHVNELYTIRFTFYLKDFQLYAIAVPHSVHQNKNSTNTDEVVPPGYIF